MSTLMPDVKLHCNIDEKAFSKAMFCCRLFVGFAMIYLALGSLFYWREFLVNANSLGFPFVVPLSFILALAELFLGLLLLLGWHTRLNAFLSLLIGPVSRHFLMFWKCFPDRPYLQTFEDGICWPN